MQYKHSIQIKMILVTGGTGFIGAHLLFKLVSMGVPVRAMKRERSSLKITEKVFGFYSKEYENLLSKIEWIDADFNNHGSLMKMLKDINKVYHCAGFVSFKPEDKSRIYESNLYGTKKLLDAVMASDIDKFCHLSSSSATDKNFMRAYVTEEMIWRPKHKCSDYARTKFLAELAVFEAMAHGLRGIIVNPTNILGPYSQGGTSLLFQAVMHGLMFYPEGINGFVDVGDVTTAMILLMDSNISGERFIINAENLAYKDVFKWIAAALKVESPKYLFNALESKLAWEGIKLYSKFSGKSPPLTKDNLTILSCHYYYSNEKIKEALQMRFTPVQKSIKTVARLFLEKM
ncbi:MAG: hypothetical protein B6D64_07135 [Bacteroidetes bacterium 4484_276]|nr:MAG: hypothetical protein B6D64_07135 [Bacteroidetes bacterium 4484_276]